MAAQKSLFASLNSEVTLSLHSIHLVLYALFFCSGCSALIYQVMWQRMLFTVFGVDLVSVTVIVSVFMFGLGLGGLLGGYLADRFPSRLLMMYVIIEVMIALFGFISPALIDYLGHAMFSNNEVITAAASFLILAIPTLLMGATFPVLVTHVYRYNQNVGESVGGLYFANTLGGAIGAYLAGFVLLYSLDSAEAVYRAACLNLVIASIAWLIFRRRS